MDIVILAAGRGTRLKPLTDTLPKPLVPISGRGTLLRLLDNLPSAISRIVIVVNYLQDQIRHAVGKHWRGRPVVYLEQTELDGTGGALRSTQPALLSERFMVANGDDLYGAEDLEELSTRERGILVKIAPLHKDMETWFVRQGCASGIRTSPMGSIGPINTGAYLLGQEWFETFPILVPGKDTEWSLPHAIPQLFFDYKYEIVEAEFWQPCGTFEEIAVAEAKLEMASRRKTMANSGHYLTQK